MVPPVGSLVFFLAIALFGMGQQVHLAGLGWIGLFALIYPVSNAVLIVTCFVSTMFCWWIVRDWNDEKDEDVD